MVPGYAIGTVIGQNGAQLDQLRSEHPGVSISLTHIDKEETFAGQWSHQMELSISGLDPQAIDHVKSRVEILIDRAGASHKPPQEQTVLVDVEHAGHARLAHADLRAFHVCPIEFKKTTTGSNRKYFVLQKVLDIGDIAENCNSSEVAMLGTHILPTGATGMPLSGTSTSFKKRHQRQSCPVPGFRRASANSFFGVQS